jgi:NitT/TauT family transport system ATP-binding protein
MTSLFETLAEPPMNGRADLPQLTDLLGIPDEEMLQLLEGGRLLGFVRVEHGDAMLLPPGRAFVEAENPDRKPIFAEQLLHNISLASHIRRVLDERRDHRAPENRFLQELEDYLTDSEAERVLEQVIDWGRFAEIFEYDYNSGVLSLPEEALEAPPEILDPPPDNAAAE